MTGRVDIVSYLSKLREKFRGENEIARTDGVRRIGQTEGRGLRLSVCMPTELTRPDILLVSGHRQGGSRLYP